MENAEPSAIVFPNPASDILYVESNSSKIKTIRVINTTGQIVYSNEVNAMKTQIGLLQIPSQIIHQPLFGLFGGKGWEWINIWFAIGGIFLIFRRVIGWHIPVAMLAGLTAISFITWLIAPETTGSPIFHLLSGGTMIGAFFIATDPVTAATTIKGRLIFGAGVGLLTYIIRVWGGYPDGIAFAVILMNMLVPLIDYYTQPKVYGSVK